MDLLEQRVFMHAPTFTSVSADNRGEVFITVEATSRLQVDTSTVNLNSVQMYEAGPDGRLGNADDVRVSASIRYTPNTGRLVVRGDIPAGNGYRVKIVASRFKSTDGHILDGEFNGPAFSSGNGLDGGNYEFQVKNDRGSRPTVRFATSAGTMNAILFRDLARGNVNNFLGYANSKKYDGIFFTRAVAGSLIQAGGARISDSNLVEQSAPNAGVVPGEPGQSNSRGRLTSALNGGPDTGTNQFFFNVTNNTAFDSASNGVGPFTAFGQLKGSNDLAVMDSIANSDKINFATLSPPISVPSVQTDSVPVNDDAIALAGLNPSRDLILIRRVALLSKVAAL